VLHNDLRDVAAQQIIAIPFGPPPLPLAVRHGHLE
jgi:hypothetical protein